MFNAEIKNSGKVNVLVLSGSLTIDRAGEIKKIFLEAISRFKSFQVAFDNVEEVDFTFLQLLQAAKRSVDNKKKSFTLATPLPPALAKAAGSLSIPLSALCPDHQSGGHA